MENNTETQTKRQKPIFQIETKREYEKKTDKDGNEYTTDNYTSWTLTHKVEVLKPSDISEQTDETIDFANQVKKEFEKLFDKRNSNLSTGQLEFCYDTALSILGELKDRSKITVIPARAGFGKSSFICAFLYVFCEYVTIKCFELIKEQGVIIVTDKLEALRKLDEMIFNEKGYYHEETQTRFTYLLESWNKESGICLNREITEYKEGMCSDECPYYKRCKMSSQQYEQKYSPILFMTNARLYQHSDIIKDYSIWIDENGKNCKRDIIIIDEKPNMVHNGAVGSKTFSELIEIVETSISSEKEECIKRILINKIRDAEVKFNVLRERFEAYRNCIYTRNNEIAFDEEYLEQWRKKIGQKGLEHINDINTLFKDGALWCRTTIPYFSILESRRPNYEGYKTFIFDATAELDPDYMKKDAFQFLDIECYKDYKNINVHVFANKKLNMSRKALNSNNNWKIKAIIKWMNNHVDSFSPKVYAISYGKHVKQISRGLNGLVDLDSPYCWDLGSEIPVIPHFGDTKGSNDYLDAFTMIQLGWNRMPSDAYLKNTLSLWCNVEKVLEPSEDKTERTARLFEMKNGIFTKYNSPNEYMWMQLVTAFEQEIFRTAVRDFSANKAVDVYVFCPDLKVMNLIEQRLHCTIINHKDELPIEFEQAKIMERGKSNNKNKIQKFIEWIETWDGEEISITKIREMFGISEVYWKDVNRNDVVSKIKRERKIQRNRKGKGKKQEVSWMIKN